MALGRKLWIGAGWLSIALGTIGAFLPLLPTVPFIILAAFCFARGDPRLEAWLVDHPRFGHHIRDWRARGAISRKGKTAALIALVVSAVVSAALVHWPVGLIPAAVAVITGSWIWTRPE